MHPAIQTPNIVIASGASSADLVRQIDVVRSRTLRGWLWELASRADAIGLGVWIEDMSHRPGFVVFRTSIRSAAVIYLDQGWTPNDVAQIRALERRIDQEYEARKLYYE